ncbi:MAG: hypothetical protein DI563_05440 [Variovorax paradoxus]|uniref:Uncharacterized protein n=1 Tax=Variovorax paradoxus TaxID=34073 RepID=A0A2W5QPX1_VARPD|nr:MAG: hypothetical protein DI563_05440 [Variovorax paradoxus]
MSGTVCDFGLSPEQTRQAAQGRQRAEAEYRGALRALAVREAEFLALDRLHAGAAKKLEALGARQRAAIALEHARRGVINACWADGCLVSAVDLQREVEAMLADIAERGG